MRQLLLLLVSSFCVVVSITSTDFIERNQQNVTVTSQQVRELPTVNTNLVTEYNTDYYRNNNRQVTWRPVTRRPVVKRPTNNRRPATNNRRPPQTKPPINWDQSDTCGGNILIPLSEDQNNALIEETYQSTGFPVARTYPLICTWNVKVSKNCRNARIVLRIDGRSQLPNEKECNKGYFRISPFMEEAKICGRVGDVPPLQWQVENQKPEVITITVRNLGLDDEKSAGFSFTLQGECLPYESNGTMNGSMNTNSLWLHQIWKDSAAMGGPTVVVPGIDLASIIPWMETHSSDVVNSDAVNSTNSSGIPGSLPPTSTLPTVTGVANISNNLNRPPTSRPVNNRVRTRPTRRPNIRRPTTTIRPITTRSTTTRPISWDEYDTCGGVINVPLLFDRLSSYESSHFFNGRNFPLVCTWNVKVNPLCRRARVTMRVDVRSRLADVEGCTKGYYTVSPFMKEARICGRIGTVPPFQWYVDDQKPEDVTVFMENIGLNDSRSEGISFSLQSECIRPDVKKIDVDIENYWSNNRWINRVSEESANGDGPRVVLPGALSPTTVSSLAQNNLNGTRNPSSDPENQSEIPWLILKSPNQNQSLSTVSLYTDDSKNTLDLPNISDNQLHATPVSIILQASHTNQVLTAKPIATTNKITVAPIVPLINQNIPWVILKSPNQSQFSSSIYPIITVPGLTTTHPTTQRLSTSPSITVRPSTHPTLLSPTTSRLPTQIPTISKASTTKNSVIRSPSNSTSLKSTSVSPSTHQSSTTIRPTTKSRFTSTKGSSTTMKRPTTVRSSTTRPQSTDKIQQILEKSNTSTVDINSDVAIQEAILYLSLLLEETKKRNDIS